MLRAAAFVVMSAFVCSISVVISSLSLSTWQLWMFMKCRLAVGYGEQSTSDVSWLFTDRFVAWSGGGNCVRSAYDIPASLLRPGLPEVAIVSDAGRLTDWLATTSTLSTIGVFMLIAAFAAAVGTVVSAIIKLGSLFTSIESQYRRRLLAEIVRNMLNDAARAMTRVVFFSPLVWYADFDRSSCRRWPEEMFNIGWRGLVILVVIVLVLTITYTHRDGPAHVRSLRTIGLCSRCGYARPWNDGSVCTECGSVEMAQLHRWRKIRSLLAVLVATIFVIVPIGLHDCLVSYNSNPGLKATAGDVFMWYPGLYRWCTVRADRWLNGYVFYVRDGSCYQVEYDSEIVVVRFEYDRVNKMPVQTWSRIGLAGLAERTSYTGWDTAAQYPDDVHPYFWAQATGMPESGVPVWKVYFHQKPTRVVKIIDRHGLK